jgi:hypothetical protein
MMMLWLLKMVMILYSINSNYFTVNTSNYQPDIMTEMTVPPRKFFSKDMNYQKEQATLMNSTNGGLNQLVEILFTSISDTLILFQHQNMTVTSLKKSLNITGNVT